MLLENDLVIFKIPLLNHMLQISMRICFFHWTFLTQDIWVLIKHKS